MTLNELLVLLRNCSEKQAPVRFDFPGQYPTTYDSYRGYYEDVALGHGYFNYADPVTVEGLIAATEATIGSTYSGWKGGEFTMKGDTKVWVANPGNSGGYYISAVRDRGYDVVLEIGREDW